MDTQEEWIYCISGFDIRNKSDFHALIREFQTWEEACNFPGTSFVVRKRKLHGEDVPGTGLFYPNVFRYTVSDLYGNPYFLSYGMAKSADNVIKTRRFAYYDHEGSGTTAITDRNGETAVIELSAGFDAGIEVISNLFDFLVRFEERFSSDWKVYRLHEQHSSEVAELKKELEEASRKIKILSEKLKKMKRNEKEK